MNHVNKLLLSGLAGCVVAFSQPAWAGDVATAKEAETVPPTMQAGSPGGDLTADIQSTSRDETGDLLRALAGMEEAAAAAASLQEQAGSLSEVVSVFKLDHGQVNYVAAPQRTATSKPRPAPVQPPRAKQAIAAPQRKQLVAAGALAAGGGWETF